MSNATSLKGTWTEAGIAKLNASYSGGPALLLREVALGDGAGSVPVVSAHQTVLVNEVWRGQVNSVTQNPDNPQEVVVDIVLPFNVGDFWVREWGLFDEGGALLAVGPHAEFYKPVLGSGQAAEIMERIILPVTQAGAITLSIASGALATQNFVQTQIKKHDDAENAHGGALSVFMEHINETGNVHGIGLATNSSAGLAVRLATNAEVTGATGEGLVSAEQLDFLVNSFIYPGAFQSFFEQTPPNGWKVRNGAVLVDAEETYPELWEALQEPKNAWKCKTLVEWTALSTAAGGVGGVPFFVLDQDAKTIKLPDTRGDYERGAGSTYLSAVGEWHEDAIRNIMGTIAIAVFRDSNTPIALRHQATGALTPTGGNTLTSSVTGAAANTNTNASAQFNASLVVPTASENRTRAFAVLPCVYVGGI